MEWSMRSSTPSSRATAVNRALRELGWEGRPAFADSFSARLVGLMAGVRANEPTGTRLMVFWDCRSIHTCFMRAAIDVAFIDEEGCVLRSYRGVAPWRIVVCPGAAAAIERMVERGVGRVGVKRCRWGADCGELYRDMKKASRRRPSHARGWLERESNPRHEDFQSSALPTELSSHVSGCQRQLDYYTKLSGGVKGKVSNSFLRSRAAVSLRISLGTRKVPSACERGYPWKAEFAV